MTRERSHWREWLARSREWIEKRNRRRYEPALMVFLVVGLTVLICSAYVPAIRGFEEGEDAPRTIAADKDVTVVDLDATKRAKDQLAETIEPVYVADTEAFSGSTDALDAFMGEVQLLRYADITAKEALSELEGVISGDVTEKTLKYLLESESETFDQVKNQALLALGRLYARPITEDAVDGARENLRGITDRLAAELEEPSGFADAVYEVAVGYVASNQVVDEEKTEERVEEILSQLAPISTQVVEGDTVVEEGETVTGQQMLILQALDVTGTRYGWNVWLGIFLVMVLEGVVLSRLLYRFHKGTKEVTNTMLLAVILLMLGGTAIARLLIIHPLSAYVIPVAAMGMVVSVTLNARSALLMVTLASVNVGLLTDLSMRYTLAAFLVGALSLYLVSKVTKRAALLATAFVSMLLAAFTIFALEIFTEAPVVDALRTSLWGLANGFLTGLLAIVTLLLLESVFNLSTPLRLLELADPAHPLLKRLLQIAPGTYNHSIMMGTLAEAAAESIGANPNLARVGAYYHDIGKIARPEYFVENQIYVGNPHDNLSPHLSKVAIAAHVRDGERMGLMYGLPTQVVDIVKQHHGNSLLAYFYNKAKETSEEPVSEDSFRYEGERPQSKEAGIIMLADGVEAAVRALERPTRRKIQGVIKEIIKQRVDDGQLDDSALTQSDLHHISHAFDMSLVGLLGHRIQYPGYSEQPARNAKGSGDKAHRHKGKPHRGPKGGD